MILRLIKLDNKENVPNGFFPFMKKRFSFSIYIYIYTGYNEFSQIMRKGIKHTREVNKGKKLNQLCTMVDQITDNYGIGIDNNAQYSPSRWSMYVSNAQLANKIMK